MQVSSWHGSQRSALQTAFNSSRVSDVPIYLSLANVHRMERASRDREAADLQGKALTKSKRLGSGQALHENCREVMVRADTEQGYLSLYVFQLEQPLPPTISLLEECTRREATARVSPSRQLEPCIG